MEYLGSSLIICEHLQTLHVFVHFQTACNVTVPENQPA